ncbi:MAG: hypothetical protein N4A64_14235 [Marinisporobacter sp.]|jgi:hypothetical protein|nr:hypothetical protein [Marinisporobacter sp.]
MGWIIMCAIAFLLVFIFIPFHQYKSLYPIGLISLAILYMIDSTFIELKAFSYSFANPKLSGLPTFYWLSGFAGGLLLVYYYPLHKKWQLSYLLFVSLLLLILEFIMYKLRYFHYHKWSLAQSYFLNILGFAVVLWFSHFFSIFKKDS